MKKEIGICMTATWIMEIKDLLMEYGMIILIFRLLASSKIELTDEMVLKTGNTALVVKIKES